MNPAYTAREIAAHWNDANWWRGRLRNRVVKPYFRKRTPEPVPYMDESWDNLIILDACRYDLFESLYRTHIDSGTLEQRCSGSSATVEFLNKNFGDETHHDTVYVTANTQVNVHLERRQFHDLVPVWKEGWDETLNTVTPETMREYALDADADYPEKRLIVHFIQPHAPYIGADRLESDRLEDALTGQAAERNELLETMESEQFTHPFELLENGEISKDEHWSAYRSNLEVVLPVVDELMGSLRGRTVVTSDHGEAFGEMAWPFPIRIYGHPPGMHIDELIEVPWLVSEHESRKTVTEDPPTDQRPQDIDDEEVETKLHMLGYK